MRFSILTLFPGVVGAYLEESIMKRAIQQKKISVDVIDIRAFTRDKHRTADDRPFGGGPGMVMKAEPILAAYKSIRARNAKVLIMSATGAQLTNERAASYAKKYKHIILIAGHYEGIDERVKTVLKAEEVSVGPFVLTGGELPALAVLDATVRRIPGVLGNAASLEEERGGAGIPVYTRPEVLTYKGKRYAVPKPLRSGDHAAIRSWREAHRKRAARGR